MSQINALASQVLQDPAVVELSIAGGSTLCFNVAGRSYTVEQAGKGFTLYDGSGKKEMKNAAEVLKETGITVPALKPAKAAPAPKAEKAAPAPKKEKEMPAAPAKEEDAPADPAQENDGSFEQNVNHVHPNDL